jgi:type IV secretory pathway TrbF-like protein
MAFPFRSPPKSFAADPPDTPYARAQEAWDRRMGTAVKAAETWRAVACGAALSSLLLGAGLTAVALQSRTYVHVVEVAPEGQVLSVRPADPAYSPTDAQVSYFLGHFIRLVRMIPTDRVVLRENWLQAYHFLTPQAAQRLNEIARDDDPFATFGDRARGVIVRSIVQRSEETWQVSWLESTSGATAGPGSHVLYTGLFTVAVRPPTNATALAQNPLGIFITEFSWAPETEAPPSTFGGLP